MTRSLKPLVAAFGALTLALTTMTVAAVPARAADPKAATAAVAWLADPAQMTTAAGDAASASDALIAFAAVKDPSTADEVATLVESLRTTGAEYAGGDVAAAAKLAVALEAVGQNPRTFLPGMDLIAAVRDGVQEDGAVGAFPSPFSSGMAAVALARADEAVPAPVMTYLLQRQRTDGGFVSTLDDLDWSGKPVVPDADNTGMGLLALLADDAAAPDAKASAIAWAAQNQATDGAWEGWNRANSTAVMGSALASAGENVDKAVAFLVTQQQPSGAFVSSNPTTGDTFDDALTTTQAVLLLAGVSYLDVAWPNPAQPSSPGPHAATPTTPGAPGMEPWLVGGVVVLLLGGAAVLVVRRRART
ncbi:MAG: hypothetical protein IPL36_00590 [Nigerium sp.]|nr:hypothetical protein [Nigerium sp.]